MVNTDMRMFLIKYNMIKIAMIACMVLTLVRCATEPQNEVTISDVNTPLHLLQPDYDTPYGVPTVAEVKSVSDRVLRFLEENTPAEVMDKTGKAISVSDVDSTCRIKQGRFRLTSYEWGVTYSAMLSMAEATGDTAYRDYAIRRMQFLADCGEAFGRVKAETGFVEPNLKQVLTPHALDDCGAICAAMIKAMRADGTLDLQKQIDIYFAQVMKCEHRLADGTMARKRPQYNTLWLDDMFMGIPAIAHMGAYKGDEALMLEAARQVKQYAERMFVPEKNLFRHGWVESMTVHPAFFWGRANGWAMLTMCEVLDVLPESHPAYPGIMELLRRHIAGVAALQSPKGFWHQLLDYNDTYLESSCTAIYTYCIAHAINKGWIDAKAYGPVALLGWNAVATSVTDRGEVNGTCVGTGMGFDAAFYAYRPVSPSAAHGYGPVVWAASEVINLCNKQHPRFNDSAVQFYDKEQTTPSPIFSVEQ